MCASEELTSDHDPTEGLLHDTQPKRHNQKQEKRQCVPTRIEDRHYTACEQMATISLMAKLDSPTMRNTVEVVPSPCAFK